MVQNAISFIEPFSFNGIRFFIAFLLLASWYGLFLSRKDTFRNKSLWFSGLKIGFWLFLGYAFQTFGLLYTTPSKAGFITGLSVVLVPIFSMLILKQWPSRNGLLGVAGATFGLYLMTASKSGAVTIGDFLVFLCAICFAMHIITTAKYAKQFAALPLTIIQIFTVSALSFCFGFVFEKPSVLLSGNLWLQSEVWSAIFVTAIFATALAFLAQTYYQVYASPTRVALIFAMEPVFAAITSYLWIHRSVSPFQQ